ncbi:MAG: LPS export ABC transporter permease LptG, partial [Thiogranum sp.]
AGARMKRLDSYIGKTVLSATLLAWLVVSVLDALFTLLGELGDIGRGDYGLADALMYVLLGLPMRAWQAFPMAALIGVVLGLGNLAAQFELDALRLAGCSPRRLTLAVMQTGLVLLLAALILGEGWAPHGEQLAQQLRREAIYAGVGAQPGAGFWVRDGQRFIQVQRSEGDGSLHGVVIYQLAPGPRLQQVTAAASARPRQGQWLLEDVNVSRFLDQQVAVEHRADASFPELIDVRLAQLLTRDADSLSLPRLGEYIDYLRSNGSNGSDVAGLRMNYWQRLGAPLSALVMLLLAVSLVLGPLGRRPLGQRLLVAVLAGLVFKLLTGVIAHAALVYGLPPALGALLPSLVVVAGITVGALKSRTA